MSFLNFLTEGLSVADNTLGDRNSYIGASDVGQCLKNAYLSKKVGKKADLRQLLIFERGYVAEGIIKKALENKKVKFDTQVELSYEIDGVPFKPHLDFVIKTKKEIIIIECKTTNTLDNEPKESWVLQIQLQMGICQEQNPTKKVRGYIIAFNLNSGEAREWPCEPNKVLFEVAIKRGKTLWEALQKNEEPAGEVGDLCSVCAYKGTCNTLRENGTNLPDEIVQMALRAKELSQAEKESKSLKDSIKAFMEAAGIRKGIAQDITVSLTQNKGRETVDGQRLREEYPEIYSQFVKVGEGYSTLRLY